MIMIANSKEHLVEKLIEDEVEYLKGTDLSRERVSSGSHRSSKVERLVILRDEARQRIEDFLSKRDIVIARDEAEKELLEEKERQREREAFEQGFQEWKKAKGLGGNL